MSSFILPALPGLYWPLSRKTNFVTLTDMSLSKRVANLAIQQYATYTYTHIYSLLRESVAPSEIKQLVGLFNACRGRHDSFLYTDPLYNTVIGEPFGTGDGTTTQFQIIATMKSANGAGGADIIQNFNGAPTIYDNGGTPGSYLLGATGIITFATAPLAGHALTWSGSFYQRCHFLSDTLQVRQIMKQGWEIQQFQFESVLL